MSERSEDTQGEYVTYVVVVHGIGEQRKNECVINVVNRFAEARRRAEEDDNRDVLTLGKASGQTGWSKVPVTEQPWIEFDGIPATPGARAPGEPFLGEPPKEPGENLRFVDLCWSDVMQGSIEHVGQDVDLWAKGLLGRLLRKHKAALDANEPSAQVPLWIRRVLYLLADTLLLVRFAMNFRFKEMKELVFVKFLGDVQLYGEYDRCRGQAVRRFHEVMAKVEAAHYAKEPDSRNPRTPRYAIVAHSLGSIMSLDALLYASATSAVRLGREPHWKFAGYLRDGGKFAPPDTRWVRRVQSFVTLGSPVDKYLALWWSNYRYLNCAALLQPREEAKIRHFNYCDELDPVGHNLDVVRQTRAYKDVFECPEDVVFNRYSVPGVAHNKYWTDQPLFRWILHRAVDNGSKKAFEPRWFRRRAYRKLLRWLYSLIPLTVLLGTYASLSLAFQGEGWRTAAMSAAVFSFLIYFGGRLIDLSTWWRQIQRQKSSAFWEGRADTDPAETRKREAKRFRRLVATVPLVWFALTVAALGVLATRFGECASSVDWFAVCCDSGPEDRLLRLLLVATVFALVAYLLRRRRLPVAYRSQALDDRTARPLGVTILAIAGWIATGAGAAMLAIRFVLTGVDTWTDQAAFFGVVATTVYTYRLYRFRMVKKVLCPEEPEKISFEYYAGGTCGEDAA